MRVTLLSYLLHATLLGLENLQPRDVDWELNLRLFDLRVNALTTEQN